MRKLTIMLVSVTVVLLGLTTVSLAKGSETFTFWSTSQEYEEATGQKIEEFYEAPMLRTKVAAGELLPVEERLPKEPLIIEPVEKIGKYGGTLRYADAGGSSLWSLKTLTASSLFRYNQDGSMYYVDIAKSYGFSEDLKTLTIELREGHKWSDGQPFTVDDILFWWEDIKTNEDINPTADPTGVMDPFWRPGGESAVFKKISPTKLEISFAVPYPVVMDLLGRTCYSSDEWFVAPRHYLEKWHIKYNPDADRLAKEEGFDNWIQAFIAHWAPGNHHVVGRPYFEPWVPVELTSNLVLLERNPYFHQIDTEGNQLPYIDRISCIITNDRQIQLLKATSGELDLETYYLNFKDMPVFVENQERGNYRILQPRALRSSENALVPNQNHEDPFLRKLFGTKEFRIALSIGINREAMNKALYFNQGQIRQATPAPGMSFYNPEWTTIYTEYDPEGANEILDSLGLTKRDSDGFRLRPNGELIRLTVQLTGDEGAQVEMVEMVALDWAKIGLKTDLDLVGGTLFWERNTPYFRAQFGSVHLDRGGLFGRSNPLWYGYNSAPMSFWGPQWTWWFVTEGEGKGAIEPPDRIKEHKKLFDQYQQTVPGTAEFNELGERYYGFLVDELFMIGTIGMQPWPMIVSNRLHNVPAEDTYWTSDTNFFAPYQSAQWYLE